MFSLKNPLAIVYLVSPDCGWENSSKTELEQGITATVEDFDNGKDLVRSVRLFSTFSRELKGNHGLMFSSIIKNAIVFFIRFYLFPAAIVLAFSQAKSHHGNDIHPLPVMVYISLRSQSVIYLLP